MAAPEGNQFWKLRSKHGRDKLFATSGLLWDAACEYFQWCDDNPWKKETTKTRGKTDSLLTEVSKEPVARPYTMTGLCLYLDCNLRYFALFTASLPEDEKDFNTIITRIEQTIYTQKFEGAAVGAFNASIIARDLGLKDASTSEVTAIIEEKPLKERTLTELETMLEEAKKKEQ